jgi:hypothetical protein
MDLDIELDNYKNLIEKYDAFVNGEQIEYTDRDKPY